MNCCNILLCIFLFFMKSTFADPRVVKKFSRPLNPRGYSLSVRVNIDDPNFSSIDYIKFYANVNRAVVNVTDADFSATIRQPTDDGFWVSYNINQQVKAHDLIVFKMYLNATFDQGTSSRFYYLGEFYLMISHYRIIDVQSPNKESCDLFMANCEESLTTVGGKSVCKGAVIFEDNFEKLDTDNKWKYEIRIPTDNKESFVLFHNDKENCYVDNGHLQIMPYFAYEIRNRHLNLKNCTPIEDKPQECRRTPYNSQILPPITSAKIQTKHSFSFRYGKVVVRAKLPKGDWLFPIINLEPLENFYGYSASGQMLIAFSFGNEFLLTDNFKDISRKVLFGGPILVNENQLYDSAMASYNHTDGLEDKFHDYALIWTPTKITLEIDGNSYGHITARYKYNTYAVENATHWQNNIHLKPFDREFFLTLGVAAGGHLKFPNGCLNGEQKLMKPWQNMDPKAMLNFWNDRKNWLSTWEPEDVKLKVDYVKVYAL